VAGLNKQNMPDNNLREIFFNLAENFVKSFTGSLLDNAKERVHEIIFNIKREIFALFLMLFGLSCLLFGLIRIVNKLLNYIPGIGYLIIGLIILLIGLALNIVGRKK